jgi:hypothetical protein
VHIVVNHLTRMAPEYICVAGVNPATGKHIRPTTYGRLSRELLRAEGGPFDVAAMVDIGDAVPEGIAPELEDHHFNPTHAHFLSMITPDDYWTLLNGVCRLTLVDIFGSDLQWNGKTCWTERGKGMASLGCLKAGTHLRLMRNNDGKLRMQLSDGLLVASSVSVTDIRLFADDHVTILDDIVDDLNRRMQRGVPVILSVGLSRSFAKAGDRHWLQVNGIHLEDNPVWRVERTTIHQQVDLDDVPF